MSFYKPYSSYHEQYCTTILRKLNFYYLLERQEMNVNSKTTNTLKLVKWDTFMQNIFFEKSTAKFF